MRAVRVKLTVRHIKGIRVFVHMSTTKYFILFYVSMLLVDLVIFIKIGIIVNLSV